LKNDTFTGAIIPKIYLRFYEKQRTIMSASASNASSETFHSSIEELMEWMRKNIPPKFFKAISVVAKNIILNGKTYRVKYINVHNDDHVYTVSEIWEMISRGFFELSDLSGNVLYTWCGMRKFVYIGTKGYKHALPFGEIEDVVFIEKENGECGHVGAFILDDIKFWIVCSKHVPIIFEDGKLSDIVVDKGNEIAMKIADVFNNTLSRIENPHGFHDHLTTTRTMWNFEAILPGCEHIVSYKEIGVCIFFSITSLKPSSRGLTSLDPISAIKKFEEFGLRTARVSEKFKFESPDYHDYLAGVSAGKNTEGVVAYGLNENGDVICVYKWKAIRYDLVRLIREAFSNGKFLRDILASINKYFSSCSDMEKEVVLDWKSKELPYFLCFYKWLIDEKVITIGNPLDKDAGWVFRSNFITFMRNFDNAVLKGYIPSEEIPLEANTDIGPSKKKVIVFVGPPGSGKSTASRAFLKLLRSIGLNAVLINSDEMEGKSKRKPYMDAIMKAMEDPKVDYILLDKTNLDPKNREDLETCGIKNPHYIVFYHPDGPDALEEICVGRVIGRVGHRTLTETDPVKVADIVGKMLSFDKKPIEGATYVDVLLDPETTVKEICGKCGFVFESKDVLNAVEFAKDYEVLIGKVNKNIKFVSLGVEPGMIKDLIAKIPREALVGKKMMKSFHVTAAFFANFDPELYMKFVSLIGEDATFKVYEIVWDDKVVAFRVRGDFKSVNKFPHITVALADGVKPFESNNMLAKEDNHRITLDEVTSFTSKYM
jgi:hypothetical protein